MSLFLLINCSENATEPEDDDNPKTFDELVLGDDGTEDSLITVLRNAGFKVNDADPYYEYNGENIESYKVVIFLNGLEWFEVMSDKTQ